MFLPRKKKSVSFWIPLLLLFIARGTASEPKTANSRRLPTDDTIESLREFSRIVSETDFDGNPSEGEIARNRHASPDGTIENLTKLPTVASETVSHETSDEYENVRNRRVSPDDTIESLREFSRIVSETDFHGNRSESEIARNRRASPDDIIENLKKLPTVASETVLPGSPSEYDIVRHRRTPADGTIANLQRLSRIASGIAFQLALLDKSLSPDEAVAELFHIGSLKLQNVLDLDTNSIDKALKALESIQTPTDHVKKVEQRLIDLDKVRRTSGFMTNFAEFSGRKEFERSLKLVEGVENLDVKMLSILEGHVGLLKHQLSLYRIPDKLSEYDVKAVDAYNMGDLLKLETMEEDMKKLDPIITTLKAALPIKEHANFMDILFDERKIRDQIPALGYLKTLDDIGVSINNVAAAQKVLRNAKSSFDTLKSFAATKTVETHLTNKFTSGFASGSYDLEHLARDLKSFWIKERVGDNKVVMEGLRQAFKGYQDIGVEMKDVEKLWNADLGKLFEVLNAFSNALMVPEETKPVLDLMKKMQDIDNARIDPGGNISTLDNIKSKIDDLSLKLSHFSLEYSKELEDLTPLKTILTTNAKIDKVVATKIVSELMSHPRFHSTIQVLEKLELDLEVLVTAIPNIFNETKDIIKELRVIDLYHKGVNKQPYTDFFTALHAIGGKTSVVKEAVEALQKSRIPRIVIQTAKSEIVNILNSKSHLEEIRKMTAALGNGGIGFKDTFKDYGKVTQELGNGVQGLLAIQTAYKSKYTLVPLLENVNKMLEECVRLTKEDCRSMRKLVDLRRTFRKIESFMLSLDNTETGKKKKGDESKSRKDFKTFESVFEEAAKIPDFRSDDVLLIETAMVALNNITNNKFADAKSALDKLDTFDLEFAKFKIGDAKDSLTAMDTFFVEYTKKLKAVPTSTVNSIESERISVSLKENWPLWLFIFSVVFLVVAIGLCFLSYTWWVKRDQKGK